jgi:hypothetical protein
MLFATNSGAREKMRLFQQEKQIRPADPERALIRLRDSDWLR